MQRPLSHTNPPPPTHARTTTVIVWVHIMALHIAIKAELQCDYYLWQMKKLYSTIKQLIAFERRHIWCVKVLQAEKCYLIVSIELHFLFLSLSLTRYILNNVNLWMFEVGWQECCKQYQLFSYRHKCECKCPCISASTHTCTHTHTEPVGTCFSKSMVA